jgi:glycosyltransferase involved in cell wall biosynthesis
MRIAFVTRGSVGDIKNWSGIIKNSYDTLKNLGHELVLIDNIGSGINWWVRIKGRYCRWKSKRDYYYERDIDAVKSVARRVSEKLKSSEIDAVFIPVLYQAAFIETKKPIFTYDDGPFNILKQIYNQYDGLCEKSILQAETLDQDAMRRVAHQFYASSWAANAALQHQWVNPQTVSIVPFGANIDSVYKTEQEVQRAIENRSHEELHLLFVGLDWKRKGLELALETLKELKKQLGEVTLHVVSKPEAEALCKSHSGVHFYGVLDKNDHDQKQILHELYKKCHLFFMPTQAECFGIVFAEAAAYGMPSISTNVGGVADAVKNGENGFCLEAVSVGKDYAELMIQVMKNRKQYEDLCISSFRRYNKELNWRESFLEITKIMKTYIK